MRKRLFSFALCFAVLLGLSINSFALASTPELVNSIQTPSITYFDDGSSLEIVLKQENITTRSSSYYVNGGKYLIFRDNDQNKVWEVDFDVTFKVTEGVSATCTAASFSAPIIYDDSWRYITNSVSKNGSSASGTITMKKYFLGLPIRTEKPTITVTCDKYGNLT